MSSKTKHIITLSYQNIKHLRKIWQALQEIVMESTFHKHAHGDFKIMLIENDKMLLKNEEVAKEFNKYFGHILIHLIYLNFLMKRSAKDWMILIT